MILVTGATGRFGAAVVRALAAEGMELRSLVRKGSEYYWLNDTGCRYHFGDLRDPESLGRALKGCEGLIIASGLQRESRHNHHQGTTIDGHRELLSRAVEKGVGRALLLSCLGCGAPEGVWSFEARRQVEQMVSASAFPTQILRLGLHQHHFVDLLWPASQGQRVWLPGPGEASTGLTRVEAAAAAALEWARARQPLRGLQELATSAPPRELLERAAAATGLSARISPLPRPAMAIGRRLGRPLRRFAHQLDELHRWWGPGLPGGAPADLAVMVEDIRLAWEDRVAMADPAERERRMVHPQFYATVYQPGKARLDELPSGPPPRRT